MKIETDPSPETPVLRIYVRATVDRATCFGAAIEHEMSRRAVALGLQLLDPRQPFYHASPLRHELFGAFESGDVLLSYNLLAFTARKGARALRMRLLEEMVVFVAMHRNIEKWAEDWIRAQGTTWANA